MTAMAQSSYDAMKPFGFATRTSRTDASNSAVYNITGGGAMTYEEAKASSSKIVLTSDGTTAMDDIIKNAIKNYSVIIFDGSNNTDFWLNQYIAFDGLKNKTLIGVNGARLCTKFYLTSEIHQMLNNYKWEKNGTTYTGVKKGSTSSGSNKFGNLPNGQSVGEESEYLTRKALMEHLNDNDENFRKAGVFQFKNCENFIIRNLKFVGPGPCDVGGYDLMSMSTSSHFWVDHCEFTDGMDGNFDITNNSDFSTISWCTFAYTERAYAHMNTNLVGSSDSDGVKDGVGYYLNLTWAYNHWGSGCDQRMPMARAGKIHMLNNYYTCTNNSSSINPRKNSEFYIEGNYFADGVKKVFSQTEAKAYVWVSEGDYANRKPSGASSTSTSGSVSIPYTYSPKIPTTNVPTEVGTYAGATLFGSPITPPTPTLYTVTYNVNGHGTCDTSSWTQTSAGQSTTLPTVTANSGYTFLGWATSNSATTAAYTSGANYTPTANITLYAVYQQNQQGEGTIEYTLASHGSTANSANSGISYTIPGTYIAGGGNVTHTIGTTTDNGVKMRTGNASFSGTSTSLDGTKKFEIDVNEGYAITAITFKAANNYANTSELTGIYVDGDYTNNLLTNSMTFNSGKAVAGGSFSGFTAKQKIEFAVKTTAEGSVTGTQLNFLAAITYKVATPDPTSVIVSPANKTIEVGETLQLSAQVLPVGANQNVTWSSSDSNIATVDASGLVTAKATGTVKITARAENGLTDYCVLTVVAKQSGGSGNAIVWDFTQETAQTLTEGETYTFTANDGSTTLTYKAGSGDKIEGTPSYLRENGGTNSAGARGIFLNVQGQGTLSIYCKDTNKGVYECYNGSASGTKLADYTAYIGNEDPNYTSTVNVTDANGLFIKTTTKGYIYKITWTPTTAPTTQYITKHISSTGWASFVPEKSVVVPDDVDVYYVKSGSYNAFAKTVQAVKIPAGTVIKGDGKTGYIVNASKEGDYEFEVSSDEAQSYDENILACGENEPIPNGSLVFACYNGTSGFYALDNYAINLPVGIVYLPASVFTGTGAPRAVTINFDEATVINNSITKQFNNSFFNINGQKVDANYRGIIIRNGRKYINK